MANNMKILTKNEISYVNGGIGPLAYIASSSILGMMPGMVLGLAGQVYVAGMLAVKQKPPYTIGSAIGTAIGGLIWTSPILGVGIAAGAAAGAAIGTIRVATGFASLED